jgi:aminoglycoside phosphotransferase (APT) family kinase protein
VEECLPGTPATNTRLRRKGLLSSAVRLIDDFHARTSQDRLLDHASAEAWVDQPLRRMEDFYAIRARPSGFFDALDQLRSELVAALVGRATRTCWIHGDFWPGNVLASDGTVTGVVDWDRAQPDQLRLHDLLHLHLFARRLATGDELGEIVVRAVRRGISHEIGVPADRIALWLDGLPERAAILLYWLRHVSLFIASEGHRDNRRWRRGNLERVLAGV